MQKFNLFFKIYAPAVLRLGMVAVILWFSVSQFLDPVQFTGFVPDYVIAISHLSATMLVYFNASFELVFGLMLAFGFFTRISALLLALHLFDIMCTVGYGQIGVRDFGLAVAMLVVSMNGSDALCVHQQKNNPALPSA